MFSFKKKEVCLFCLALVKLGLLLLELFVLLVGNLGLQTRLEFVLGEMLHAYFSLVDGVQLNH